ELAFGRRPEPVQHDRVVANLHAGEQPRAPSDRRQRGGRRGRHEDLVADPRDRDHDAGPGLVRDLALEEGDHRASLDTRRMRDCCRWQRPTATASAASGCRGTPRRPCSLDRAERTCALSAAPIPVTAILTSSGPYSSTGNPASEAASMITPVARATASALTWFRFHATRSTATEAGRCSAIAPATAAWIARSLAASSDPGAVRTVPAHTRRAPPGPRSSTDSPTEATPGSTPSTR